MRQPSISSDDLNQPPHVWRLRHRRGTALLLALLAGCALAATSAAQTNTAKTADKTTQTVRLFDAVAKHPGPSWQKYEEPLGGSEVNRQQRETAFIQEQIPKGDSFKAWKRLYGVVAQKLPGMPMQDFINQSLTPLVQACGRENFTATVQPLANDYTLIRVVCQNTPHIPVGSGYGEGVGEVGVFWFGKQGDTLVKIYQQWRGSKFSASQAASWPVSSEEVDTMTQRLSTTALAPAS
ncbi:hypothetical protein V6B08_16915 [Ferrovibrio sp. MS7]|uniref:hypothetical protein n=1 Tax=Ferrovibrio plantarum TaxID=3119164 RepID=UPI003135451C